MLQTKILDYFGTTSCDKCKKPVIKKQSICFSCIAFLKRIEERRERKALRVTGSECFRIQA